MQNSHLANWRRGIGPRCIVTGILKKQEVVWIWQDVQYKPEGFNVRNWSSLSKVKFVLILCSCLFKYYKPHVGLQILFWNECKLTHMNTFLINFPILGRWNFCLISDEIISGRNIKIILQIVFDCSKTLLFHVSIDLIATN